MQIGFVMHLHPPNVDEQLAGDYRFILVSGADAENGQGNLTISIEAGNNPVFNDILEQLTNEYGEPMDILEDGTAYWE